MYRDKPELRIPGPVPVPSRVLQAAAAPMINHRGADFRQRMPALLARLQRVFRTENCLVPITGSGTAAMEAAVSNLINPGDPVMVFVGGSFGERWAQICRAFGAQVHELTYSWGEGLDPERAQEALQRHPEVMVVFATQNESSTGVLNDIQGLSKAAAKADALFVVDAVSSLGGVPLETDDWDIDVVVTASQKCLMAPPGLAFVSLSSRARERMAHVDTPRYYLDLLRYCRMLEIGETPFTPNISALFALEESLAMLEAEGLSAVFSRHRLLRDMVRAGVKALGLALLVPERWASPTVTAIKPDFADVDAFRRRLLGDYGVEVAGGQGELAGQILRIGHMGYVSPLDMLGTLGALEACLGEFGVATAAAEDVWERWRHG